MDTAYTIHQPPATGIKTEARIDPKRLVIVAQHSPGREDPDVTGRSVRETYAPNAQVVYAPETNFRDFFKKTIREAVTQNGTLDRIVIDSHGDKNTIISNGYSDFRDILKDMDSLQSELGTKITDRIVPLGCNMFRGLSPSDIELYRGAAKKLGTEIAAGTEIGWGGAMNAAALVRFSADGSISTDPAATSRLVLGGIRILYGASSAIRLQHSPTDFEARLATSWADHYTGNSPDEAHKNFMGAINLDIKAAETERYGIEKSSGLPPSPTQTTPELRLSYLGPDGWQRLINTAAQTPVLSNRLDFTVMDLNGIGPHAEVAFAAAGYKDAQTAEYSSIDSALKSHETFIKSLPQDKRDYLASLTKLAKQNELATDGSNIPDFSKTATVDQKQPNLLPDARPESRDLAALRTADVTPPATPAPTQKAGPKTTDASVAASSARLPKMSATPGL